MTKYAFAAMIAFGALQAGSTQAAPVSSSASIIQSHASGSAMKVRHCRRWSGGWGCRWHRW
jgi:hypothetical protein